MEKIDFEGVNLAELLPRIPDAIKNALPFGLVKLDLTGKILEYNMAEGELTGVDPAWAMGKNFFDEVAVCTKTQAFYGRFVEGVKRGFMNTVFDFTFDHRETATNVKVHMFTMPDSRGQKTVMLLVKRSDKPLVMDALSDTQTQIKSARPTFQNTNSGPASAVAKPASQALEIQDIVNAVIMAMNQGGNLQGVQGPIHQQATPPPPLAAMAHSAPKAVAAKPAAAASQSRHQDILKF